MAVKEWDTDFSGANPVQDADPITGAMPDLVDLTDDTRSSQVEKPRDKLQAVCKLVGDSVNAPSGSLADILDRDHANGDARQLRLRERASDPTPVANKGFVYAKDDAGVTELYYIDSAGNVYQLSPSAKANLNASAAPAVGDDDADGYSPGSLWVDTTGDKAYVCVDASTGAAIWIEAGGGSSPLTTKGDLYGYSTADARIPVGTDGQILTSDSSQATGVKWDSPITAQGVRIEISDGQPASSIPINTTDTKVMPDTEASIAFEASVAGKYGIQFTIHLLAQANSSAQVKLVFDEGTGDEQSVGYTDRWQVRQSSTGDYIAPCFFDEVTLAAGSHTVKAYAKIVAGSNGDMDVIGSAVVQVGAPVLVLNLVSGSAAGGILLGKVSLATTFLITNTTTDPTGSPNWQDVTGMSLTFSTFDDEWVEIVLSGVTDSAGSGWCSHWLALEIDGTVEKIWLRGEDSAGGKVWGASWPVQLAAGSHTVQLVGSRHTSDDNINVIGANSVHEVAGTGFTMFVRQYRGGHTEGGAILLDSAEKPSDQNSITSGVDTQITGLSLSFTAAAGDDIEVSWCIQAQASATENSCVLLMRINSGSWFPVEARTGHDHLPFCGNYTFENLTAGAKTVDFGIRSDQTIQSVRGGGDTSIFGHPMTSKTWARR